MTAIGEVSSQARLDELGTEVMNNYIGQMRDIQGQFRFVSDLTSMTVDAQRGALSTCSPETLQRLTRAVIKILTPADIEKFKKTQKLEFKDEKDKLDFIDLSLRGAIFTLNNKIKNLDPKVCGRFKSSVELAKIKQEKESEVQRSKEALGVLADYFTLLNSSDWVNLTNELQKNKKPYSEAFMDLVKSRMSKVKA